MKKEANRRNFLFTGIGTLHIVGNDKFALRNNEQTRTENFSSRPKRVLRGS